MNWSYLISVAVAVVGSLVSWLWRHSTRLTKVETRQDSMSDAIKEDRDRADKRDQTMMLQLQRIEDKIDRKADKA